MNKLLLFLTAFLIIYGCSSDKKNNESQDSGSFFSNKHYGGTINEGTTTIFTGFLPYVSKGIPSERAINLIYSKLFKYDYSGNVVGDIVESYKISSNILLLSIKNNIKWHNGNKLLLEDVIASLKIARNKGIINRELNFEIIDNKIKITFQNKPEIKSLTNVYIIPADLVIDNKYNISNLLYAPVGTGAYKYISYDNETIKLKYFNKYYNGRANIDNYNIFIFHNEGELLNELNLKKINFVFGIKVNFPEFKHYQYMTNDKQILIFNSKNRVSKFRFYLSEKAKESVKRLNNDKHIEITNLFDMAYNCSEGKSSEFNAKNLKIRFLVQDNDKFLDKVSRAIKNKWSESGIKVKIIKRSLPEILYYFDKGLKSDVILIDWKNFNEQEFIKIFNRKNNLLGFSKILKDKDFIKKVVCSGYVLPLFKTADIISFKNNIKNIKLVNKRLSDPVFWYISN